MLRIITQSSQKSYVHLIRRVQQYQKRCYRIWWLGMEYLRSLTPIKKARTISLYPQSDGLVKRNNCTVNNCLSRFVANNPRDWDNLVPLFLLLYRSRQQEGRETRLTLDLMFGKSPAKVKSRSKLCQRFGRTIRKVYELARNKLQLSSDSMKDRRWYSLVLSANSSEGI